MVGPLFNRSAYSRRELERFARDPKCEKANLDQPGRWSRRVDRSYVLRERRAGAVMSRTPSENFGASGRRIPDHNGVRHSTSYLPGTVSFSSR